MLKTLWARITGQPVGVNENSANSVASIQSSDGQVVPFKSNSSEDDIDSIVVTKKDRVERLNDAVNRLVDKLDGIREHLGSQVDQNEQILDKIRELPDLLKAVPNSIDRQEEAISNLVDEIKQKSDQDRELNQKLANLPEVAEKQSQTLDEIGKQAFASAQSNQAMSEQFGSFSESLKKLDSATTNQTEWIQEMTHSFNASDRYIKMTFAKQQKRFLWIYIASLGACLLAIAGLVVAYFVISGMGS